MLDREFYLRNNDLSAERRAMERQFYEQIKRILSEARNKVYQTANFAMVEAYWNIGKKYSGTAEWI